MENPQCRIRKIFKYLELPDKSIGCCSNEVGKKFIFSLAFVFMLIASSGQTTDSTAGRAPETWKRFHIGLRAGIGIQKSFFTEAGLALQKYVYEERHGFMVLTMYTSFEWIPATSGTNPVYGIKAGYELVNNGGAGAIEIKYLFDSEQDDVVITPKFGFGIGLVNLFYGYNISTNKYPFPKIRKHQFSLIINTNLLFYHMGKKHK